jgi:RNA polymerase sigma-70 factor (ECF subfamily)
LLPVILASAAPACDRDKLERLYTAYYPLMFAAAMKVLHDPDKARDAVHEAVMNIIRHLDRVDEGDEFAVRSFLCVVAKHCAIDLWRRENKSPVEDIEDAEPYLSDPSTSPLESVGSGDGYAFLVQCIGSLSDACKTVCQLRYIHGLRETEIADLLGLPPKTVSSRIYRGKQSLIQKIRESGYYGERYGKE